MIFKIREIVPNGKVGFSTTDQNLVNHASHNSRGAHERARGPGVRKDETERY
jgi:hypothetical protein